MKTIELTKGMVALVDDEDFEYLNSFSWQAYKCGGKYYAGRRSFEAGEGTILMHRAILEVTETNVQVDHRNHNTLDNQRHNIRKANNSLNQSNRVRESEQSGMRGVVKDKDRYRARIGGGKNKVNIGTYNTPQEAAIAYNTAAIEMYGDFARLNTITEYRKAS